MAKDNEGQFTATEPATLTFPNLEKPRAVEKNGKPTGEPKYSAGLEMDPGSVDLASMKSIAMKLAKAKWPGRDIGREAATKDANGNTKLPTFVFPFSNGSDVADKAKKAGKDREFSRGKTILTARSKFQPKLSIIQGGKVVDIEPGPQTDALIRKAFYNGTAALYQVVFNAYDGVGNGADGVNAYLNMVLSLQKGDKLSGGVQSAADVFKGYIGTISDEDPTAGLGLDDEIPL